MGLYLNPPDKAIVLCVDEKSQTQALERSQPILPLRPGLPSVRPTIMCVMALFLCLPLTTQPPDASWADVTSATVTRNSWPFWNVSTRRSLMIGKANFTSSLTTIPPIKPQKSIAGCYVIHAFIFTSLPLAVPGSTGRAFLRSHHYRGHSPGKLLFGATTPSRH